MSGYQKVDLEKWPRRDHYRYYTEILKVEYNVTVNMQVEKLLAFCRAKGYRFYPAFIAAATRAVNSMENFRMFRNEAGELCLWEHRSPSYTIFHSDDKTFSDCWSEYAEEFAEQYEIIAADMERYKDCKGMKAREGQPANFYCVSCAPWLHFIGYSGKVAGGEPQFFPVITAGKYEKAADGSLLMPVNLTIAHAVCDGYHAGEFFRRLQEELDGADARE